jgi:D-arabinose 1-dehydrogenase-like Zn-dependent alcohol dehydrogenase
VRIVRAGVNPTDWKFRAGAMGEPTFPEVVPGQDGAGVVDAVGSGVTDIEVGDRVWTMLAQHTRPGGTAQELVVLPVDNVTTLPDTSSFEVGAALGVPVVTAHRALTTSEDGPDRLAPGALAGVTVLVAGGAGAVGNAAIQLARWAGATVISTVSSDEKATLAKAAGAQHAVNYREGDPVTAIRDLAIVADKGFAGEDFEEFLAGENLDLTLVRPARKNEKTGRPFLNWLRQRVEAVIWTLKHQLGLERHGGRVPAGLWARIVQRLLALNAAIWHNWMTGARVKRSLIAYDHV